jgi:uncharacterized damage-inducible protein DinB
MANLVPGTFPAFMVGYLKLVTAETIAEAVEKYSVHISTFFQNIPNEKVDYRYDADKWNIKEMLQHIIDAERIFAYRTLRIARNDKTPLAGFDEKSYAAAANANERTWNNLLQEFCSVRKSTDLLLLSFSEDQLQKSGTTNNEPNTAKAISYLVYGHILHHINILKERYL